VHSSHFKNTLLTNLLTYLRYLQPGLCQNSFCGWRSAPDPTRGAYCAPPDLLGGLRKPTSKERKRKGKESEEGERGAKGKVREGEGLEGMAKLRLPFLKFLKNLRYTV